jgi:hypothetical protein
MSLNRTNASVDNEKLKISLAASFLLSFTLLFFGPAQLYFTNICEIPFLFSDIWYRILAISIFVGLSFALLLWWLKGFWHSTISTLVFAIGLLFWIQGNILVWNYGLLNGQEIFWNDYLWNGIIDSLIWIGVIIGSVLYSKRLYPLIGILSTILIIIQICNFFCIAYVAPEEPDWKYVDNIDDKSNMFEFSIYENILVIILDSFQSDIFDEIIDEDSRYADMFNGFTYYRNSVGGHPSTYASVMYILSGKAYDNSMPIQTFIKNRSLNDSLPFLLKMNQVKVYIIPAADYLIYPNDTIYDRIFSKTDIYSGNSWGLDSLYRLTFFRYVPQFWKHYFYITLAQSEDSNRVIYDLEFCRRFISDVSVSEPKKVFNLFHLDGAHPPWILNENLEWEKLPGNRSGYKTQAKASLSLVHSMINSLKQKGAYDNSLIFIIGDHGSGLFGPQINFTESPGFVSEKIISGGIPLILIKPFNSSGSLKISDAPVSLGDVPKTVAEELHIPNNFSGYNIFLMNETEARERTYFFYEWAQELWGSEYFTPINEFKINGSSWSSSSWQPTYRLYTKNGVKYNLPPHYNIGSIVHFGIGGDAEQYLGLGWSGSESGYRWTDGHRAAFICSLSKSDSPLVLNLEFRPWLDQVNLKTQRMSIWINEHKLRDVLLTEDRWQSIAVEIPNNLLNEGVLRIVFILPDAISSLELNGSGDPRKLGLLVKTLSLESKKKTAL